MGTPKTKRGSRVVPVDQATAQLLRRQREAQGVERTAWGEAWNEQGLVFTREDGRPLRPEYVTRHFQPLAKEAGLPIIRLHDLRHTIASIAPAAGVHLEVVSDRLGHSTTATTADLYTHVSRGVSRAAAEKIAEALTATVGAASDTDASASPAHEAPDGPERRAMEHRCR